MSEQTSSAAVAKDHLGWVRTRLTLERDLRETTSRGFALIAAGFGSFAIFDGLAVGEHRDDLPLAFALVATAIGVALIFLAMRHFTRMTAWIDADEFGAEPAPMLPNEQRDVRIASAAIAIGTVSFIALLLIR